MRRLWVVNQLATQLVDDPQPVFLSILRQDREP